MKYLKLFNEVSDYEAYKNGSNFIKPNVSYIKVTKDVLYTPKKKVDNDYEVFITSDDYNIANDGEFYVKIK